MIQIPSQTLSCLTRADWPPHSSKLMGHCAAENALMVIKYLQNDQKWNFTKLGEEEEGMALLRTMQSNASLDKNPISVEAVTGRVKVAAGEW